LVITLPLMQNLEMLKGWTFMSYVAIKFYINQRKTLSANGAQHL
jgi:hypothetical protein